MENRFERIQRDWKEYERKLLKYKFWKSCIKFPLKSEDTKWLIQEIDRLNTFIKNHFNSVKEEVQKEREINQKLTHSVGKMYELANTITQEVINKMIEDIAKIFDGEGDYAKNFDLTKKVNIPT